MYKRHYTQFKRKIVIDFSKGLRIIMIVKTVRLTAAADSNGK